MSARLRLARFDHFAMIALMLGALLLAAKGWLDAHPQHNPWAPLDLNHPPGWATQRKLAALRSDPTACRAVLERSGVAFTSLAPVGEGACSRPDRTVLPRFPLSPAPPPTTCAVAAALQLWLDRGVQPAAQAAFGVRVARIEQFGAFSCRRIYGRADAPWSEHATGNAIDIAGFVLADGRRVRVLGDWSGGGPEAVFLRQARDAACTSFGTVLGPDYNAAHRDHLHLDQAPRGIGGVCQ